MDQASVFLGRFPFSNRIDYKIRPAVIVSNSRFNKMHSFVWACPITSRISLPEFELEIPQSEFSGKLNQRSFIRADSVVSMERDLFLKEIGKISEKLFGKLRAEIIKSL